MPSNVLIIDGHPDPDEGRFCHALANAYRSGAEAAGHGVRTITLGGLDFPLLRTKHDFDTRKPVAVIAEAQRDFEWADTIVLIYPLWLGTMPALVKGFLEQVFRPDFAFEPDENGRPRSRLKGRRARVVITMGMPALAYRWFYLAHSLKSLERNILKFSGIAPVRDTVIGMVENLSSDKRRTWLERMRVLGQRAR